MKRLQEILERDKIAKILREKFGDIKNPYKHPHRDIFVRTADKILEVRFNHRNPAEVSVMRKKVWALLEGMLERIVSREPCE